MGRPKKNEDEILKKVLIRLYPKQLSEVEELARNKRLTVAQLIRNAIDNYIAKDSDVNGRNN